MLLCLLNGFNLQQQNPKVSVGRQQLQPIICMHMFVMLAYVVFYIFSIKSPGKTRRCGKYRQSYSLQA